MTDLVVPECTIGGVDAVIDALVCAVNHLTYFISLTTVSSEFAILGTIFTVLIVVLVFILISLIRGN
jgi:heme/copper-type cytochrome/quinol oxidase subunit 4